MPGYGMGDGNAAYLGKTLRYNDIELGFDESVSWRTLGYLWLRAFVCAFVPWGIFGFFALLTGISSITAAASGTPGGDGGTSFATLLLIGNLLGFLVFWIVLLATKIPEPIAEWRVLLSDRGDKADSVYSHISGTLRNRQLPVGWRVRRIRTGLGPTNVSNRLELKERSYTAYVSVFSYGTSLYLGWMMWRRRRGASLIKQFILDVLEGMLGRKDLERQMMRTERPRAMREAVHAACREGLFTAIEGQEVPLTYGFPQGLPQIEDAAELGPAPIPVAAVPGTRPDNQQQHLLGQQRP